MADNGLLTGLWAETDKTAHTACRGRFTARAYAGRNLGIQTFSAWCGEHVRNEGMVARKGTSDAEILEEGKSRCEDAARVYLEELRAEAVAWGLLPPATNRTEEP